MIEVAVQSYLAGAAAALAITGAWIDGSWPLAISFAVTALMLFVMAETAWREGRL